MGAKLLFLAGSSRKASLNKQLAKAAHDMAKEMGAAPTFIDLADYDMPIYNGDYEDEHGAPEAAKKLKKIFTEHDGFFIACPEYNSGYPALLKNTIDWMTRPMGDDAPALAPFQGKVGAISAASPGGLGGMRVLVQLRMLLGNIGVHVIPAQAAISNASNAFNENNSLKNDGQKKMLHNVIEQFVSTAEKLK